MTALLALLAALAAAPPHRPCALPDRDVAASPGDICMTRRGANYQFLFIYPHAAANVPPLNRLLRSRRAGALRALIADARAQTNVNFDHEEVYRTGADRPELLAISYHVSEYSGGAHGWYSPATLLWDRRANRRIEFEGLLADRARAFAEMRRLICPALADLRRRLAQSGRGGLRGTCEGPPYSAGLIAGRRGRIRTLRISLGEIEGYAGGQYDVYIPVTAAFVASVQRRFRPAFQPSRAAARGCNPNLEDRFCRRLER